jgi:hypothetical protein
VIKNLVNDELLPDLHKTRDAAQKIIDNNLAAIKKCNADSTERQTTVKSGVEAVTDTDRTTHAECRETEKDHLKNKTGRCAELDSFLNAIEEPAVLPDGRPRDRMVEYVEEMNAYFCPKGNTVETLNDACTKAEDEHAAHQADCNEKQAVFELAFCTWRTELVDACGNLDTCHGDAVLAWDSHVKATQELVKKWKTEFKALHKIMCYTDVWLNNDDKTTVDADQYEKCKTTEEDDSVMEVDPGTPEAKTACDLKPVETHPGSTNFPQVEYSNFADFAIKPIPCLTESIEPAVIPVKEG